MDFRGCSESTITITITADALLSELLEDGPEAFANRFRSMLETELQPLLEIDWKRLRGPGHPARLQDFVGH